MERYYNWEQSRHQQLLTPLRESIVDKPPYISGTLQLPDSCISLFYKTAKDGLDARFAQFAGNRLTSQGECLFPADILCRRYINLANATPDELEQLTQACEPASFGLKKENVLDETYRKAGKMDPECFSSTLDPFDTNLIKIIRDNLLEGLESKRDIKAELYKLNIYGKGSFFKPHVDTPHSETMFGSLVLVFPTPHEGGALFLRHHGHEWVFDSATALSTVNQPTIGYVAFFSDIEHEVAPVTSGHRITLTYNLYFDDGNRQVPVNGEVFNHLIPSNKGEFSEAFEALLGNPEFMADGGTLAFGLRHVYPIKESLENVYDVLKGSDASVYQSMRALGFDPVLYLYYDTALRYEDEPPRGTVVDKVMEFNGSHDEGTTVVGLVQDMGGTPVLQDCGKIEDENDLMNHEQVEWVAPLTTHNRQQGAFATYGNEATLEWVYGDVCMFVRIGKVGDRLAFPTVAEVKRSHQRLWSANHRYRHY